MKAKQELACAASCEKGDWQAIHWQPVNQNVRRLQARIVKTTQEGRCGKVKTLQCLLTHSYSGKVLAPRRVTENQGKNTPEVDRVERKIADDLSPTLLSRGMGIGVYIRALWDFAWNGHIWW